MAGRAKTGHRVGAERQPGALPNHTCARDRATARPSRVDQTQSRSAEVALGARSHELTERELRAGRSTQQSRRLFGDHPLGDDLAVRGRGDCLPPEGGQLVLDPF